MPSFGRLLTAMVTPFGADGEVDCERAGQLAERLLAAGNDGVVVAGTTGESPVLSHAEKIRLFAAVREAVGRKGLVMAGTGSNNTADSVELSRRAAETGVDGLLLVTPYYNKPPQEGLYQHFGAIARAVEIPVMLYNVPTRTVTNLQPGTVVRLARDFRNIVAVKECVTEQVAEILAGAPDLDVYSGDDAATLPMLAQGAVGVVSVAGHVVSPQIAEMIAAHMQGNPARAAALHRQLLPVFRGLFATTNPILVKAALEMTGFPAGDVRLPLVNATEAERTALRRVLEGAGLL